MGLDEIPPLFLKYTAYVISKPLAHIINCSLMSGVVPNDFKRARVVPVYKSSAHDNFENYRPITVLPAISKILQKCVHSQLIEHLGKNNLLSQNQFGFHKYRSIELAVVWFTDQIRRSMDPGMLTGTIYVDMSKAFEALFYFSFCSLSGQLLCVQCLTVICFLILVSSLVFILHLVWFSFLLRVMK